MPLAQAMAAPRIAVQRAMTPEIRHPYGAISQVDAGYSARRAVPGTRHAMFQSIRRIGNRQGSCVWGLELPEVREVSRWWARNE